MSAPAGLALLAALQVASLDQAVLIVRRDSVEVARETFHLRQGRLSTGAPGWILTATSQYGASESLSPILELGEDSLPLTLQYDVQRPTAPYRIFGRAGPGRFLLRYASPRSERAREMPAGPRMVILDDSLFAFYAVAAWFAGTRGSVSAVYPRTGERATLTVTDRGEERTVVNGDPATARHVVLTGGPGGAAHVWLGPRGVLLKVELPERRLSAERLP